MRWSAIKLYNTDSIFDFWDKSDPYMKFLKIRDDNTFVEIQRTEIIKENLNPAWKPIGVPLVRLVNPNKGNFKYAISYEELRFGTGRRMAKTNLSDKSMLPLSKWFLELASPSSTPRSRNRELSHYTKQRWFRYQPSWTS